MKRQISPANKFRDHTAITWRYLVIMCHIFILCGILSALEADAEIAFTRVTTGIVVDDGGTSAGAAWGDYNNDGNIDLFVANWFYQAGYLYQNNGAGAFVKITSDPIVSIGAGFLGSGPSWGDFDNNGFLDMYVGNQGNTFNFLFINNGDGTFTRITEGEIANDIGTAYSTAWGDYDNDGYLDMFVPNADGQQNPLYHNNGDSTFTRIYDDVLAIIGGDAMGASWGDYDNDGNIDLFVACTGAAPNLLFRNNGDGSFTRIVDDPVVLHAGDSHGGSWGDYDNDGDLDLFVANGPYGGLGNFDELYNNNGDGSFTEVTGSAVTANRGRAGTGVWGDFDNDGDLDLFVTNYYSECFLYENDGAGNFTRITEGTIVTLYEYSSGAAAADYDNDGDLDLFLANWENHDNLLYRNDTEGNNWVKFRLVGTISNSKGFGAKVRIKADIESTPVWQMREIRTNNGKRSQSTSNACFGLGDAPNIDSVMIEWPSGVADTIISVTPNLFYTIIEGQGVLCPDQDSDGDGHPDAAGICPPDNCPDIYNPGQEDADFDEVGDACDNCLDDYNPDQDDPDEDDVGTVCDNCPDDYNPDQDDPDEDDIGTVCDNCPDVYNPDQMDTDGDNIGDLCDYICGDADGDFIINILDIVFLINYLYKNGPEPIPLISADVNHDELVNILDIVYIINFIYKNGPEPACE